jgi:hypothetical protein
MKLIAVLMDQKESINMKIHDSMIYHGGVVVNTCNASVQEVDVGGLLNSGATWAT